MFPARINLQLAGVSKHGEEGRRTDQVRDPGNHFQRHGAVAQAGQRGFESLNGVIKKSLRGGGLFTIPGLLKLRVVKKPATKAREGVNPFTGQKMMFKAKPASKKVRAVALKSLKSMVN